MRRRSSHLVFLVVLLCSVQLSEDFTLQIADGQIHRRSSAAPLRHSIAALPAHQVVVQAGTDSHLVMPTQLDPSGWTTHRTVWTMPRPASAAASVNHHTGLLRA
jgi:hypothetical protein